MVDCLLCFVLVIVLFSPLDWKPLTVIIMSCSSFYALKTSPYTIGSMVNIWVGSMFFSMGHFMSWWDIHPRDSWGIPWQVYVVSGLYIIKYFLPSLRKQREKKWAMVGGGGRRISPFKIIFRSHIFLCFMFSYGAAGHWIFTHTYTSIVFTEHYSNHT